ncbi:hypothetical protein [Deinococcus sonorensis]|uniref:Restriction system protein Mrr-like N-terminal domain-containing protein n=2 Tax=Deinococcus sonorensis TaxID=309891 RepID=A0AAU7U541_9DEIO
MSPDRPIKQRLPDHLRHLSRGSSGPGKPSAAQEPAGRRAGPAAEASPVQGGSARLSELLPHVLRAMVGDPDDGAIRERPRLIHQPELLEAMAPYHRPRSRFEELMVRKLVGEGYLKPRGARDKSGLSDAYELTPKGERVLGLRHDR